MASMRRCETSDQAEWGTARQVARSVGGLFLPLAVVLAVSACGPRPGGSDKGGEDDTCPAPGAACEISTDCGHEKLTCVVGRCRGCRDDGDCVRFSDCRVCGPGGACVTAPGCCRGDLDCPTSFACDRAPGSATGRCADEEDLP
jgi:hypothetical protein